MSHLVFVIYGLELKVVGKFITVFMVGVLSIINAPIQNFLATKFITSVDKDKAYSPDMQ